MTMSYKSICAVLVVVGAAPFLPGAAAQDGPLPQRRLVINEVMASNGTFLADPQGQYDDWIEIHNPGAVSVDTAGMYLTDDPTEPTQWQVPTGRAATTTIRAGGFLIVWADGDVGDTGLHAGFGLDADGDEVHLFDADGETLIDSLVFEDQTPDVSFGRYPDAGETVRFFGEPTPGGPNNEGYLGEVAPIQFSHARGFYQSSFDLTLITATDGAEIIYTLDGKVPDDPTYRLWPGRTYTQPLPINKTTCVRAMAIKEGFKPTRLYTHTYIFNASDAVKSLPAVSLVGDEGKTFYEPNGVMAIVGGSYGGSGWVSSGPDSYNHMLDRGLERPVSAEWIDPGGGPGFQIDCGLRVHGSNYMRPRYRRQNGLWSGSGKISFRLYFRGRYGPSRLEFPLFAESDVEEFASIVLRGGHNDRTNPFIKDELVRRLHQDMGQRACMGNFANLFINGQYKGYFNPTEHVKEEACQLWFDSDRPWDVMTMNGIRDGDSRTWDEMINYARSNNMADPLHYAEITRLLDVTSFIDYLIIRLWGGDWDWPQNNWSAAGERSDAPRWKFFVWDAEGSMFSNRLNEVRFGELNSQSNANGRLYQALKVSRNFRQLFADRIYKHFFYGGVLTDGNIQRRFFAMRDVLRGVIPSMDNYVINGWVPNRLDIFLNACVREGMYTFDGPVLLVNGIVQQGGDVSPGDLLSLFSSSGRGTVYYTLDGTEPGETTTPTPANITTLVASDASKRVLVPTGSNVGDWHGGRPFNDSTWHLVTRAPGGVGYENSSGYEGYLSIDLADQMYGVNGSCYIRIPFTFTGDKDAFDSMTLRVQYDDGFIAYLNGTEIARRNFNGNPAWNSRASAGHSDSLATVFESIDATAHIDLLEQGDNILAIHGLNNSVSSSDLLINAELTARELLAAVVPDRGIPYTEPIVLTRSTRVKARAVTGSTWSALSDVTFAVGPVAQSLRISEIMYHPTDPNAEYIELTNTGTETIDLNLVAFTDGIDLAFSAVQIEPGAYCLVVRDAAVFEAVYGPDLPVVGQYTGSLNNGGERIELQDAAGRVIHAFRYRDDWYDVTDGPGFSLTVADPLTTDAGAWGDPSTWRPSAAAGGSPGADDNGDVVQAGAVVINELLANSGGGVPDWIELHNTTDQAIDLGGWLLSDDTDDLARYEIDAETTIEPLGYLVLTEDEHFGNPAAPGCHTPFGLSRTGEAVYLHFGSAGAVTGYADHTEFGASESGVTLGRHPTSAGLFDFPLLSEPTPGAPNAEPRVGPIVISEIMYHPDHDDVLADAEYVELLNVSDANVTLYDFERGAPWRFAEAGDNPGIEFLFGADEPVTIAPGRYVVLVKDPVFFQVRYGALANLVVFEWGAGSLSDAGETLTLSAPGEPDGDGVHPWITVDAVSYSDGSHPENAPNGIDLWPVAADGAGSSLTRFLVDRYGNDPAHWRADSPSPGAARRRPGR